MFHRSSHLLSPRSPSAGCASSCATGSGRHGSCQTLHLCNSSSSAGKPWEQHINHSSCDGIASHYTTPKTTANTSCAHHHDLLRLSSSLPFYPPDMPKPPASAAAALAALTHGHPSTSTCMTAPIPIPDHVRSSSQLSQNLTASLTSLPASLPPYPSGGGIGGTSGLHGGSAYSTIPPSYPSEISLSSLPTVLSHTNHHTRINPESLLLLKKDDLDAFLSKARNFCNNLWIKFFMCLHIFQKDFKSYVSYIFLSFG